MNRIPSGLKTFAAIILLLASSASAQEFSSISDLNQLLSSEFSSAMSVAQPPVLLSKKRRKPAIKNTLGTYSGTLFLSKSKAFKGFNCTPTESFPAVFVVSGKVKRPTGQLGSVPIGFRGSANRSGSKLKGNFTANGLTRNYTVLLRKVKQSSAVLTFTEVIKSGRKKACQFTHKATFQRS